MPETHAERDMHGMGQTLSAYLLGTLEFERLLVLQRRIAYDIGGDRTSAAVIFCDHPPGITVGREGSRNHIRPNPEELESRRWPLRWVARGGGVLLHYPGQIACYPLFPLDTLGLTIARYVEELQTLGLDLLREYGLTGTPDQEHPGILVTGRRLIHLGVAVRGNITCFGLVVNVDPDLAPFRDIRCDGDSLPMTSLARESTQRVSAASVRQRLLELIAARFGFDRIDVSFTPPGVLPRPLEHVVAPGS